MADAYGFSKEDAARVADTTRTVERLYKGGGDGPSGVEPRYAGLFQWFVTTSTITAGTAVTSSLPNPGHGTANMWTGPDPTHVVVGTGNQLGLTIWNMGLASIATGTAVGCVFTNGAWYVIFVLCP